MTHAVKSTIDVETTMRVLIPFFSNAAILALWVSLLLAAASAPIQAADTQTAGNTSSEEAEVRGDPLDRDSPRGTVIGYERAIYAGDLATAIEYLDLRNLSEPAASTDPTELAEQLKVVLERGVSYDAENISGRQSGRLDDGLPDYRELLGYAQKPQERQPIYLQHVPDGRGSLIWKFSNRTVNEIPGLYAEFRYKYLSAWLKENLPPYSFLGAELFKWATTLLVTALSWLPLYLGGIGLAKLLTARRPDMYPAVRKFFTGPMTTLGLLTIAGLTMMNLGLGSFAESIAETKTLITIASVWCLLAGVTLLRNVYQAHLEATDRQRTIPLLSPITTSVRVLVILLAGILWLNNIGYEVSALLAGLGIGGLAVALVLQKPLEDVFGALTLYMQQPARVGDFCSVGAITGTVEEISLRTTRIRTLEDTVVAVPNARMASEAINNFSVRNKILYTPTINLSVETTSDQMREILKNIETLLDQHDQVLKPAARVRFASFGPYSLELKPFAYIETTVFADYLVVAEQLNLAIMDLVEAAGARIVSPHVVGG
jgi:MscS family membrane protein